MIVPDGIEPVIGWRTWGWDGVRLYSQHNSTRWQPGVRTEAKCGNEPRYVWRLGPFGLTLEQATEHARSVNAHASQLASMRTLHRPFTYPAYRPFTYPAYAPTPFVEPPRGLGYHLETVTHDSPAPECSCGIYAAKELSGALPGGQVRGRVVLWGKVIEGENGWRAEFGYPVELFVAKDDEALHDYGVPVTVDEDIASPIPPRRFWTIERKCLGAAVGINLGACAVNVAHLAGLW